MNEKQGRDIQVHGSFLFSSPHSSSLPFFPITLRLSLSLSRARSLCLSPFWSMGVHGLIGNHLWLCRQLPALFVCLSSFVPSALRPLFLLHCFVRLFVYVLVRRACLYVYPIPPLPPLPKPHRTNGICFFL